MLDARNKEYCGSSTCEQFHIDKIKFGYDISVLGVFDTYEELINSEKNSHINNDVVASIKFYNKAIATISSYSNPDYATYKNSITGKIARLPRTHPLVLNREWVGVSKDTNLSEETKKKISVSQTGEKNGFYGKTHSPESRKKMSENIDGKKIWNQKSPEAKQKFYDYIKQPKSEEHKKKIGRKNMIMLQHIETKEIIRVHKEDSIWDNVNWFSMKKLNPEKKYKCEHCDVVTVKGNLSRWHNDNCKRKPK